MKGIPASLTHDGTTDSIAGWARRIGIDHSTLLTRLKKMTVVEALTMPRKNKGVIPGTPRVIKTPPVALLRAAGYAVRELGETPGGGLLLAVTWTGEIAEAAE